MINRIIHVNIVCTNLERSLRFYHDTLGGDVIISKPVGARKTESLGSGIAMGFGGPAQWGAYFIRFGDQVPLGGAYLGEGATVIDLLQWTKPASVGRPYDRLNNVGLARMALAVDNIDKAYSDLKAKGVEFISPPQKVDLERPGEGRVKVVAFKDPDGTFLELAERPRSGRSKAPVGMKRMITRMIHVNIVCTDLERSLRFYRDTLGGHEGPLGRVGHPVGTRKAESLGSGIAMGFGGPSQWGAYYIGFGDPNREQTVIDLLQWTKPASTGKPYDRLNHVGIARIALGVDNLDKTYAELKAKGVEFISLPQYVDLERPGQAPVKVVAFKDPDGVFLELSERP